MKSTILFLLICTFSFKFSHAQKTYLTNSLNDINEIILSNFQSLTIVPSQKNEIVIEYDDVLKDVFFIEQGAGKINISIKHTDMNINNPKHKKMLKVKSKVTIYSNLSGINILKLSYITHINIEAFLVKDFTIDLTSCSSFTGDIDIKYLKINSSGSNINLKGNVSSVEIDCSASNIDIRKFRAGELFIKKSTSSNFNVNVENVIKIDYFSSSNLKYKGNPNLNINSRADMNSSNITKL